MTKSNGCQHLLESMTRQRTSGKAGAHVPWRTSLVAANSLGTRVVCGALVNGRADKERPPRASAGRQATQSTGGDQRIPASCMAVAFSSSSRSEKRKCCRHHIDECLFRERCNGEKEAVCDRTRSASRAVEFGASVSSCQRMILPDSQVIRHVACCAAAVAWGEEGGGSDGSGSPMRCPRRAFSSRSGIRFYPTLWVFVMADGSAADLRCP